MTVDDPPNVGFVALKSLRDGPPDAKAAIAEIRRIYFKTTMQTFDHDFAHAIELLKSLSSEEERAKAHVYMEGLAEMNREWQRSQGKAQRARVKGKGAQKREKT